MGGGCPRWAGVLPFGTMVLIPADGRTRGRPWLRSGGVLGVVLADPVGPALRFEDLDAVWGRGLGCVVAAGSALLLGPGVGEADVDGVVQVEPFAVPGRDDRLRGDAGLVAALDRALDVGQGGAGRDGGAVRPVEGEGGAGSSGDQVAAVVDQRVMVFTQTDQVVQLCPAAVAPVLDVVQVDPAGLAAREPAPAFVAFAGRPPQRRVRTTAPSPQVEQPTGTVVQHPAQRRGAGDYLRGGDRDGRAVLDMATRRVGGVPRRLRRGAGRSNHLLAWFGLLNERPPGVMTGFRS